MSEPTIRIEYTIDEAAQRAELSAGRPAHARRTFGATPTPELASRATLNPEGDACLNLRMLPDHTAHFASRTVITSDADVDLVIAAYDAAIQASVERREARRAAEAAEVAARQLRWSEEVLARGVDDVYDADGQLLRRVDFPLRYDHPREEDLSGYTPEAIEHIRSIWAQGAQRELAAKERRARIERAARDWIAQHAARWDVPDGALLARAAAEGRAIWDRLDLAIVAQLTAVALWHVPLEHDHVLSIPGKHGWYGDPRPRTDVPSAEAYRIHDLATRHATDIAAAVGLPDGSVSVGPIARFDVAASGSPVWRTGVRLEYRHPYLGVAVPAKPHVAVVLLAEPRSHQSDQSDNDD